MSIIPADWAVFAFLAVFVPVWGWFDHRSFLRRESVADTDVLSAEYSLIAAALLIGMVLNLLGGLVSGKGDPARLKAYGQLAPFLPKTPRQHRWGMALSVSAGVAEEIAYRGFVMWMLAFFMPVYAVIAVQAVVFGLAHAYQGWGGAVGTAILGAVIGLVYWATGSLFLSILLHVLVDAMSLSLAYFTYRRQAGREAGV